MGKTLEQKLKAQSKLASGWDILVCVFNLPQDIHNRKNVRPRASREYRSSMLGVGSQSPRKKIGSHIDASHSRQPLVKGERLVRYEVNAVMLLERVTSFFQKEIITSLSVAAVRHSVENPGPGTVGPQLLLATLFSLLVARAILVGRSSQAYFLERNSAMDDSIGGS